MKEKLVKLLFEEYKQYCAFRNLQKKGLELMNIWVNNLDIVLDIVGFPGDNTFEYCKRTGDIKLVDADDSVFCRDWLKENYYVIFESLEKTQGMCVTEDGLQIQAVFDPETVKVKLREYIDWLQAEFANMNSGRQNTS